MLRCHLPLPRQVQDRRDSYATQHHPPPSGTLTTGLIPRTVLSSTDSPLFYHQQRIIEYYSLFILYPLFYTNHTIISIIWQIFDSVTLLSGLTG